MKNNRLRKNLKFSFLDGIFGAAMLGLTENFWVACAEAMQVSALKAGMVSTLPHLIASIGQTVSGELTKKLGGRLKTLKKVFAVQWVSLVPLAFLPITPPPFRYILLITCAVFFTLGGYLPVPAWLSFMSDHLPFKSRGTYFGWRNRILGLVGLGCGLLAGQILQRFQKNVLWGFFIIFSLAFFCKLASWLFLIKMSRLSNKAGRITAVNGTDGLPESFLKFARSGLQTNFGRFAFFAAFFIFSVNLVAPYLTVYMLRDLGYSYSTFSYVTFAATLTAIWGVKIWGELADRFGHLRVVRATTTFIALIPLLWFVSGDPLWLVFVQIAAGFAWSGFQLCLMTFVFSEVPERSRTRALSYLSAMNGMAMFTGSYLGGNLLKILPVIGRSSFLGLFLISAFARTATVIYFFKKLKETREVQPISTFGLYTGALGLDPVFQTGKELLGVFWKKKT